ncbi:MAG: cell wall-binding repeat-containing protein [Ramlibacter sp.]|nr:cell wall-binding repeat-containing protein [Cryobacterium sp.]
MTVRNSALRIGAGSVAAALAMCTVALVGTANAATNANTIQIRPVPTQNPTDANGFQDAPFITNAKAGAKVNDFQVVIDNNWKSGDSLGVVLPAGVVFASAPTVTVTGPTTLQSVRQNSATQVIAPQTGLRNPTVTSKLSTDQSANGGTAQVTFTNDSVEVNNDPNADPNVRFVLTFTGVSVDTSTNATQGPLTADILYQNRVPDSPLFGIPFSIGTTTTLAYITNVDLSVTSKPIIPNGGEQTIGSINFAETVPEALVNGSYTVAFTQGPAQVPGGPAPTPVAVGNPNPAGGEFDTKVTGNATLNSPATSPGSNLLTVNLGGLHADGALEAFAISGVLLNPVVEGPIHVTLVSVPGSEGNPAPATPSNTNLIFNAVNTFFGGPGDLSRVPDKRGLEASGSIGLLPQNQRIGGDDRYQTAAQIAQNLSYGENRATNLVIASGEQASNGVDALSANFLAGAVYNANPEANPVPILLTKQGTLPDVTAVAIRNLLMKGSGSGITPTIYVMGGQSAVSDAVVAQIRTAANGIGSGRDPVVQRVAGEDRFSTAAAAATVLGADAVGSYTARYGAGNGRTAFIANGLTPADALSAGPIAYGNYFPVLLTRSAAIPQATLDALSSDSIRNIILLGGTTAVSDAQVTQLEAAGYTVTRVAGANRYETNTALYGFAGSMVGGTPESPRGGPGYNAPITPLLANGLGFADALTAGPLAALGSVANGPTTVIEAQSPVLLTAPSPLSPATETYLMDNKSTITSVTGVGLSGALPQETLIAANQAAS